jgi:F-type H+-transporting ATPase subunit alpha
MFNAGQRPAIDIGISVSRVGGSAQKKSIRQVVGSLKIDMAQFRELAAFAQFSSDLDPKTKAKLERGQRITEILKQGWDEPLPLEQQVALFWIVSHGYIDQVRIDAIRDFKLAYLEHLTTRQVKLLTSIRAADALNDKLEAELTKVIKKFLEAHGQWLLSDNTAESNLPKNG